MNHRPMLFSAPMVRALLDGSKTQTRRIVKPQPAAGQGMVNAAYCGYPNLWLRDGPCSKSDPAYEWHCPHGQPGDRLWVRETWCREFEGSFNYRADDAPGEKANFVSAKGEPVKGSRWKPSIHMPRAASRITLEITGTRVERLQKISRGDAMAEGCPFPNMADGKNPRDWYMDLWGQINGAESWAANPWVWVIEFKRAQGGAA